ncbi:MAG: acetylornithine transaminase [Euryarchaeota archaeon]|nr:acetylornithine transaminase [Euryarchaeota archaeon]|tara:strand:- start:572 stop:1738 length:1167 start_codon:yes stop_codon:yes gene_type:complete
MSALAKNYNRRKISFKMGKGSFLYSTDGKKYLDFVQGIAVNSLGHSNPYLIKAINKQAKKVWHVSNAFIIPEGERLAKRLRQKTFADYVIFQNSGVEATEAAIKAARRYFYSIGKPEKNRILCIKNSFHGRTLAAIYASGSKKMTEGFGPKVPGFDHFNFGDHKGLKKAITKRTAAIMIETAMGESGIKVIPDWCIRDLKKICNKRKILLILDEVQCGIGRSGKFFAFEHAKIKPDIVPIAKGIGGGFPIGAVLMNKKVAYAMKPGSHGSTFGGNPLAMSVGNAVLDQIFKKGFLKNVQKSSKYFISELRKIKEDYPETIKEVRGIGLLIGLQLYNDQTKFIKKLEDNKLLTIRAGENVVRILPPLNVKKQEIDLAIKIIRKVCSQLN